MIKKSIASIIERDAPSKLAILNESLSQKDILRQKVPRHTPENQFSNWVKGVSRQLEKKLLDNNSQANKTLPLFSGENYDLKKLDTDKDIINYGLLNREQLEIKVERHRLTKRKLGNFLSVFKFAKPVIVGDKALVYVEEKSIFPRSTTRDLGSGFALLFKHDVHGWKLVTKRGLWSGGASF